MRWRSLLLLVMGLTTAGAGCRSSNEYLEAELRARDGDLRQLRDELDRTAAYNHYLQRELHNLQHVSAGYPLPEGASSASPVRTLVLGRQTSGYDKDGMPGDDALQVVLEPRDADNHTVKAQGNLHVQALEISPEGLKKLVSSWQVSPEQLRSSWRSGLLSTGYHLILPWKSWPEFERVRVVAQFTGADSRLFEADRDIKVRLAPESFRKMLPSSDSSAEPLPSPQEVEPLLPLPRKLDQENKEAVPAPKGSTTSWKTSNPEAWWEKPPARPLHGAVQILRPVVLQGPPNGQ